METAPKTIAPWIYNQRYSSCEGFSYNELGYMSDGFFFDDDEDAPPTPERLAAREESSRRCAIKQCLDRGMSEPEIEAEHGPIPPYILEHFNAYFRPYLIPEDVLLSYVRESVERFNRHPDCASSLKPRKSKSLNQGNVDRISSLLGAILTEILVEKNLIRPAGPISVVLPRKAKVRFPDGDLAIRHADSTLYNLVLIEIARTSDPDQLDWKQSNLAHNHYRLAVLILAHDADEPAKRTLLIQDKVQ